MSRGQAVSGAGEAGDQVMPERFAWHPQYQGRSVAEVTDELRSDLEHDQRAYELMLAGADQRESAALAAVLPLEKKWGAFDLNWAEADSTDLVDRIVAFERERERRRELFSFDAYRREATPLVEPPSRPWWAFWQR